jgi:hypothetical protein
MEPILGLIVDFDEDGGVFSWYGGFHMFWRDDHISWNITEYSYINSITLPITQVWVPKPIFSNSAKRRTFFNFDNDFDHERMWILKSIVSYIPSINIVALTFGTSHSESPSKYCNDVCLFFSSLSIVSIFVYVEKI